MQSVWLYSLFNALSMGMGLISVTLIPVENKADNAMDCQAKKKRETARFGCMLSIKLL